MWYVFELLLGNLNHSSVKIWIKRCFILDMFKNVVKISCMQEIYAVVEKCRVVSGTGPTLFPLLEI